VAKKPRNRRSAGPARPGAAGQPAAASAGASAVTESAGPASASTAQLTAPPPEKEAAGYPGQRFGLPERGPGSVASMPRRLLALLIDWLLSMLIAYWLTHSQFWTIVVFAIEVFVLTATTGFTVGKRLVGIRAVRTTGGPIGFRWSLVRTAILLTVVPALLTDRDLRGLHDRASDTIVIRV
jgi:RDD family